MSYRRLSVRLRRNRSVRAGLLAMAVALTIGLGIGALIGSGGNRVARARYEGNLKDALQIAKGLEREIEGRQKALRFLASLPAVVEPRGEEERTFDRFRQMYPEFEYVGLAAPPPDRARDTGDGPRRFVFSVRVGGGPPVYAALRPDWASRLTGGGEGLGPQPDGVVLLLHSSRGWRTHAGVTPPDWEGLSALKDESFKEASWGGRSYLTGIRRLVLNSPTRGEFAVVAGVPMSDVAASALLSRRAALIFGLIVGFIGGVGAWVAIARTTGRLRIRNQSLELRVAERTAELASAERSFRGIFENVPLGLYQCDPAGRFLRANPMLAHTLGFTDPAALIAGLGSLHAVGKEDRMEFLERLRADGEAQATVRFRRADGSAVWLAEKARAVRNAAGEIEIIEGAMHDVTAQRELEDQLRRISATDPLTGLLNRRGLDEAIADAEAPISFVALDLDKFKPYNDTYGHPAGDQALVIVAEAMRRSVRDGDAVARTGGEEFVVALSRTDSDGARRVAEGLRKAVAACSGLEAYLTISAGVATARRRDESEEAFVAADRALYMAKEAGGNRVIVNPAQLV